MTSVSQIREVIDNLLRSAGYKRRSTSRWQKDIRDATVEVSLDWRPKTGSPSTRMALGVLDPNSEDKKRPFIAVTADWLHNLVSNRDGVLVLKALSPRSGMSGDERAKVIGDKLGVRMLAMAERLASQRNFVAWFRLGRAPRPFEQLNSAAMSPLGLQRLRAAMSPVDLLIVGKRRVRLTGPV